MPDLVNINDWKIVQENGLGPWGFGFRHICRDMREIGRLLYEKGFMPEVKDKPESTHGNMAARINSLTNEFIITAAGSHKGHLQPNDFVWVREVSWDEGSIIVRVDSPDKKPSTDVWLADGIFKRFPTFFSAPDDYTVQGYLKDEIEKRLRIGAVIHTHHFPDTKANVSLSYPALDRDEWAKVFERLEKRAEIIVLANHGAITLGVTLWKAFEIIQ